MNRASIQVRHGGHGQITVAVSGEVDMTVHEQLTDALTAVANGGARCVVVDLSQTSFLDSGGIRALIMGRRAAQANQADYTVTGATGIVRQVLEVTGVLAALTRESAQAEDGHAAASVDVQPAA